MLILALRPAFGRLSWTDSDGVDIAEGEDDVLILAATVVIDMACHGDRQRARCGTMLSCGLGLFSYIDDNVTHL
jgi:hypothetical protein